MSAIPLRATARNANQVPQKVRHGLDHALNRVCAAVLEWQRRSANRAALACFDERLLRDIGLTRAEAHDEINKPFWKK